MAPFHNLITPLSGSSQREATCDTFCGSKKVCVNDFPVHFNHNPHILFTCPFTPLIPFLQHLLVTQIGYSFCRQRIVEKIGCGFCRRRRLSHNWISGLPDECGDVYAYHYCKDPNARANTMNVINAFLVHLALALIWPKVISLGSWLLGAFFV